MSRPNELVFAPLGGVGEIGMNLGLYGFGPKSQRKWIIVDCGVKFADDRLPGIDVILPDTRFIEEERDNLLGIFLTHAHEDHFGALLHLWPGLRAPVYATPFSAALLRAKIDDEAGAPNIKIREIALGATVDVGPFNVEYVTVTHSIPEPNSLIITTELGSVVHTGDWKIDSEPQLGRQTDENRFKQLGKSGCRAIICDSTNVFRDGTSPTEGEVAKGLEDLIAAAPYRVAVTSFASNVARLRSAILAAHKAGRQTVLAGRSMHRMVAVAAQTGYLKDIPPLTPIDQFAGLDRSKVMILLTGSQGEPRAALARIASDSHPDLQLSPGDQIIFSSRTIPGNEKSVSTMQNALVRKGIEIITDQDGLVHVSGHPRRGELQQMYSWLKPELAIPVHGESRHLYEHARFAKSLGVPETVIIHNGDMVRLAPGPGTIIDELPAGRFYVDGKVLVREDDVGVKERRKLGFAGVVTISITVTRKGEMAVDPDAVIFGIPDQLTPSLYSDDLVYDTVLETFETIPRARRKHPDVLSKAVRQAVRSAFRDTWGKKPLCEVMVAVV
ncbi:MAG: ribonuclease J [Fimbriimonadaceae bacterium]|nr:ribonuclease J [Alphaproteobacteria bacterium]